MRPARFIVNRHHPLSNGLKFALLGYLPGGLRSYESSSYNAVCSAVGNAYCGVSDVLSRPVIVLDGTGDWISVSSPKSRYSFIQNLGIASISAWIKTTSTTTRQMILGNCVSQSDKGFFFMLENYGNPYGTKALRMSITVGSAGSVCLDAKSPDNTITDTNWHHVLVSLYQSSSATYCNFYVDGIQLSTTYITAPQINKGSGDSSRDILVGAANGSTPALPWVGKISDVMIWDRTLGSIDSRLLYTKDQLINCLIEPIGSNYYPYTPSNISWAGTWGG